MEAKITYIFPSRSRVKRFFDALENITRLSKSDNYEIICTLDHDDPTMNNDEVKEKIPSYKNVVAYYGVSNNKIHACNREINRISPDTSIICLHSDDQIFLRYGFDEDIREAFFNHPWQYGGLVHFPDGHQKNTCTYTMMGIKLFRHFGYMYNPIYSNVFADNELTESCKLMGRYLFVDKNIFIHAHPIFKLACWDSQYQANENPASYAVDRKIYNERKAKRFGL